MREINLSDVKQIEIELLLELKDYCERNDITFWLGYGSMLGCVRHGGMIPWDDDIDIIMPRESYDRFISGYKDNARFSVAFYPKTKGFYQSYAKLCDKRTSLLHLEMNDYYDCGIGIDIFPIDGLGNDKNKILKLQRLYLTCRTILLSGQYKDKTKIYSLEKNFFKKATKRCIASAGALSIHFNRMFDFVSKRQKFAESIFAGFLMGAYGEREIMHREIFSETIYKNFNDYSMPILKRYDEYLRSLYGDYMKLPPEGKRVCHHLYKAYWKQNGV